VRQQRHQHEALDPGLPGGDERRDGAHEVHERTRAGSATARRTSICAARWNTVSGAASSSAGDRAFVRHAADVQVYPQARVPPPAAIAPVVPALTYCYWWSGRPPTQ
jgi:hypothetical protein